MPQRIHNVTPEKLAKSEVHYYLYDAQSEFIRIFLYLPGESYPSQVIVNRTYPRWKEWVGTLVNILDSDPEPFIHMQIHGYQVGVRVESGFVYSNLQRLVETYNWLGGK